MGCPGVGAGAPQSLALVPKGHFENSPTFQGWVSRARAGESVPQGRLSFTAIFHVSAESPGAGGLAGG